MQEGTFTIDGWLADRLAESRPPRRFWTNEQSGAAKKYRTGTEAAHAAKPLESPVPDQPAARVVFRWSRHDVFNAERDPDEDEVQPEDGESCLYVLDRVVRVLADQVAELDRLIALGVEVLGRNS